MLTAIIVGGGSSRRMGFDKIFASLGGKTSGGSHHRGF